MEKEKAKKLCANCGTELVGKFCPLKSFTVTLLWLPVLFLYRFVVFLATFYTA